MLETWRPPPSARLRNSYPSNSGPSNICCRSGAVMFSASPSMCKRYRLQPPKSWEGNTISSLTSMQPLHAIWGLHARLEYPVFAETEEINARPKMKLISILACGLIAMPSFASAADTQVFPTSAGPVKITPLMHASTLIEAAGKTIYLHPFRAAKTTGLPKAHLILLSHIHADHIDAYSINELIKPETAIMAPPAYGQNRTPPNPIAHRQTHN